VTFRSRALLSAVRECPCCVEYPHLCNEYDGVGPMHSNWMLWGKGKGLKCPDQFTAAGCSNAHRLIDPALGATLPSEERETIWTKAYIKTQMYLWVNRKLRVN
jgi:hypothetical protein